MKPKTANPVSLRCIHRTPAGRQCRRFAADAHSALCPQHRAEQNQVQAADHYLHLTRRFHDFPNSWHRTASRLAVPPFSPTSAACFSARCRKLTPTTPPGSSSHPRCCPSQTQSPPQTKMLAQTKRPTPPKSTKPTTSTPIQTRTQIPFPISSTPGTPPSRSLTPRKNRHEPCLSRN